MKDDSQEKVVNVESDLRELALNRTATVNNVVGQSRAHYLVGLLYSFQVLYRLTEIKYVNLT